MLQSNNMEATAWGDNRMKNYANAIIWLVLTSILLTGCSSFSNSNQQTAVATTQTQVAGAEFIQHGSQLTVIIPTDTFFVTNSDKVKKNSQQQLQQIAQRIVDFANHYPTTPVRINGYTNQTLPEKQQLQLTTDYAIAIGGYLWNAGLSANRLITKGLGSSNPIASQATVTGLAHNRRVEVTVTSKP